MSRNEKLTVAVLVVLLLAGVAGLHLSASVGGDAAGTGTDMSGKLNASLRTTGANIWSPAMDEGAWSVPVQAMRAAGANTLHGNHPLYRRPSYAGQGRDKVNCEGWTGWVFNPPSETYF